MRVNLPYTIVINPFKTFLPRITRNRLPTLLQGRLQDCVSYNTNNSASMRLYSVYSNTSRLRKFQVILTLF